MKKSIKKATAILLACLFICGSIGSAWADNARDRDTKTGFPLLADIRNELDENEIISAPELTVTAGNSINLKDTDTWKLKDEKAVSIQLYGAEALDGTAFNGDVPGNYMAWYVVTPASGHPAYEISRSVHVQPAPTEAPTIEPVVEEVNDPVDTQTAAEDEESEDDPSETEDASIEEPDESIEADSEDGESQGEEDSEPVNASEETAAEEKAADDSGEEYTNDLVSVEEEQLPDAVDETEPELTTEPEPEVTPEPVIEPEQETTPETEIESVPDTDTVTEGTTTLPVEPSQEDEQITEDIPAVVDEETTNESQEQTDTSEDLALDMPSEDEQETSQDEAPSGEETGQAEEQSETVDDTLAPDEVLVMAAALDEENPSTVDNPEDGSQTDEDAAEEDDDSEEIPIDNIVLTGSAKMVRGTEIMYPSDLGSWSTFKYTVNGRIAYCLEAKKSSPKAGSFAQSVLENNPGLTKAIYYGYGGPGDVSATFYPNYSANVRYVLTHIATSYFYSGDYGAATYKCSSSGLSKYRVREWIDYLAGLEDPPSAVITLSAHNLEVIAIENGVQRTNTTTLEADHRNTITLDLPENVTYHNKDTGETQTGGQVTISGGTTFYFTAPASVSGTWETDRMPGSIAIIWKAIIVATGTKTQHLGSYATETYGGSVAFSVSWKSQFKLNIVKADAQHTDVHLSGAVIGVYSDKDCAQEVARVTTDESGNASCMLNRSYDRLYVREIQAPEGYRINKTVFTVDIPDEDSVSILIKDDEQVAGLKITKKGEVLTCADISDTGVVFHYETRKLAGATFRVTADSAIYAPDGSLLYQKGDIVADGLTTNDSGEVTLNNVPLGTYLVEETGAPAGYSVSTEKQRLTLSYAGQEQEVAFDETTFVNERQKVDLTVYKRDAQSNVPLSGAIFALFAESDVQSYKGEHLVGAGTLIERKLSDTDGKVHFTADLPIGCKFVIREEQAPKGYVATDKTFSFTVSAAAQSEKTITIDHTFTNKPVTASVKITKRDAETGDPQADAQLSGAVYGLYAAEAVMTPDRSGTVIYEKDALVATMTTDGSGSAMVEGLPLGRYYVREITPSIGYTLDNTSYPVDCLAYDGKEIMEVSVEVKEEVMKQPFEIIKAANNGKTDADLIEGAGFSAWLISSLSVNGDGSYDFSSAAPVVLGKNGEKEIFTDARGHAVSVALPYGTYIVRETTTPKNYSPVDDFVVTISEHLPTTPQIWRVLLDEEFAAKLKIIKVDAATGRTIFLPGAEFSIYDIDKGEYVTQVTTYPYSTQHKTFITNESGTLTLPEVLHPGHYRVTEIAAPNGYILNPNPVDVTVSDDSVYRMDAVSGEPVIEVIMQDNAARGRIRVYKEGEMLIGYQDGKFIYENRRLPGVVFDVIAAEDIVTADFQVDEGGSSYLEYAAGTVVATLTTDANGEASTDDLPLGSYNVIERQTISGYVLDETVHTVTLTYADQETEVVVEGMTLTNVRQKFELTAVKKAEGKDLLLPGAEFGLYAGQDIIAEGTVLVSAGTCLATGKTDETGSLTFDLDLPLGRYLINELAAPAGYVKSEEIIEVDASWQGQDVGVFTIEKTMENMPTKVLISKADATTGVELSGAQLTLVDDSGRVIDQWTSIAGEPHLVEGLEAGKTYSLKEEIAPYGYLIANTVKFTIGYTGEVQKVVMKDEVPTGTILINKTGEFLSSVSTIESALGWAGNTFSYITGGLKDVTFAVYAYEDIVHADGATPAYYKAGEQIGTITTDSTGIARMEGLPLGKYMVKEVATASGYVLDDQERVIDLCYRDSSTAVVTYSEAWQNERQKVRVKVIKLEKGTEKALPGAVFGLYAEEDILSDNGTVVMAEGTLIQQRATESDGTLVFEIDLPIGFKYDIREITPPAGYASDPESRAFTFEASADNEAVTEVEYAFEDAPTSVEITKSSLTTGEELEGAKLQVTDSDGNVVDSWISEKEAHIITGLVVGQTYTLTETLPANGYVTAESITFTVDNTGEAQPVEMKDDVTKVSISKTDLTGKKELEGAKLTILDEQGNVVESWTSTSEPHYIEMLPIGKYTLREETAPSGYTVAEDVSFEVTDTADIQTVQMKDAPVETPDNPGTPKTGDDRNPILWGTIGVVGILLLLTAALIGRKNRRKF